MQYIDSSWFALLWNMSATISIREEKTICTGEFTFLWHSSDSWTGKSTVIKTEAVYVEGWRYFVTVRSMISALRCIYLKQRCVSIEDYTCAFDECYLEWMSVFNGCCLECTLHMLFRMSTSMQFEWCCLEIKCRFMLMIIISVYSVIIDHKNVLFFKRRP